MNDWKEVYKRKLMTAEDAAKLFENGDLIVAPLSNGVPTALVNAVAKRILEDNLVGCTYVS